MPVEGETKITKQFGTLLKIGGICLFCIQCLNNLGHPCLSASPRSSQIKMCVQRNEVMAHSWYPPCIRDTESHKEVNVTCIVS